MIATGTRLGPYEIVELLGRGGMGEVYRARDPRLGRDVAIKVLPAEVASDPRRLARFEREARAVAALNHPNVLTVHDVGSSDGTPYLVTELLEGRTLRELMLGAALPARRALGLALQVARGLEAAHAKGIVHRDVKPDNVLVTGDGHAKLLDFGVARLVDRAATTASGARAAELTRPGDVAGTLSYMSPEQVRDEPVDARSDLFSLGVVLYEMLSGRHPFWRSSMAATLEAVLQHDPEELSQTVPSVPRAVSSLVARCLEKHPDGRYATGHDLAVALEALLSVASGQEETQPSAERSPFPGLESFTERDAGVYFGREQEAEAIWTAIREHRLLAVIGASGAGKTSFVRAGIVARRPEGWGALVVRPGAALTTNLARALAPEVAGDPEAVQSLLRFDEPTAVVEAFARWRRGYRDAVLVVDQLEELFTLNPPEVQAEHAALLGRLAQEADLRLLLSLRDDFLLRCGEQPSLRPVFDALVPLLPMDRQALRRVLVEPARTRGFAFEDDALVDAMVGAVEGERAALPLLAFAMARLWDRRDRGRRLLTREAYEAVGGVGGALARHAEATLERIGPGRQALVREIFRQLVTADGTRVVVDRDELLSAFNDPGPAEAVLDRLVDARLLTSYELPNGDDRAPRRRIELVHESLLRAWPRLVRWRAQDEEGALLRDQLKQAARLWEERGRPSDLLWSGTSLREFELWRQRYPGGLTAVEAAFADAMTTRARRRQRVWIGLVAAAFAAVTTVALIIAASRDEAVRARNAAHLEARRAEASQLLAMAQARLAADPTEALALTTASLQLADLPAARAFALRAIAEAPPVMETEGLQSLVSGFSRDGRRLAAGGFSEEVRVWSDDGQVIARLPGHELNPLGGTRAVWGPGELLLTGPPGGAGGPIRLWSLPEGRRLRTIEVGPRSYWGAGWTQLLVNTFSRDGAGHWILHLRSWKLPDGHERKHGVLDVTALGFHSSWITPDAGTLLFPEGRRIYSYPLPVGTGAARVLSEHRSEVVQSWADHERVGFFDGSRELHEWSLAKGGVLQRRAIPLPDNAPQEVVIDPSRRWAVEKSGKAAPPELRVWDLSSWPSSRPLRLRRAGSWMVSTHAVHPGGEWLVASTHITSRLTFWPLPRRSPVVVDGYSLTNNRPLVFSPDSRHLATSWSDWSIRVWDVESGEVTTLATADKVSWNKLAFDPRGRFLFAVGLSDHAYVLPLDGAAPRRLEGTSGGIQLAGAAVSPSGRRVATAFSYGAGSRTLRVWDIETDERRLFGLPESSAGDSRTGLEQGVYDLAFSDETTLYTSGDGGVRVWDLESGRHELVYEAAPGDIVRMAASRDGSTALVRARPMDAFVECRPAALLDLSEGAWRSLPTFGDCVAFNALALDPEGEIAVTGDHDGVVRVGRLAGDQPPHQLFGHVGTVDYVAISPDRRWVASTGDDNTLRLWPMPDLDRPPLHKLPREELVAKLHSLTNLRAVRDPDDPTGWTVELGPFPGWKEVPEW